MVWCLATATPLRHVLAQPIRGTVRDSASHQPLPIAAVLVLDGRDRVVTRVLTDGRGAFAVTAPNVTQPRLRVLHIGYRPVTVTVTLSTPVEIALARLPATLEPVPVTVGRQCPDNDATRRATALWERARSALITAIVARESRSAAMEAVLYQRIYRRYNSRYAGEWRLDMVYWQAGSVETWRGASAFRSDTSASFLETVGYASPDFGGRWPVLHYPDEAILFDESFVRTHCFAMASRSTVHRDDTGIAFEPTRDRGSLTDIAGALWLGSADLALRSVEFTYTHPPYDLHRFEESTGLLSFAAATNGTPLLTRWRIRHPPNFSLVRGTEAGGLRPGDPTLARLPGVAAAVFPEPMEEDGGELALVRWDDGTEWKGTLPVLVGRVRDEQTGRGVPGAVVTLVNGGNSVRADSAGVFRFPFVEPGPGILDVVDTTYAFVPRNRAAHFDGIREGPDYARQGNMWSVVYGMGIPRVTVHDNQASIMIDSIRNDPISVVVTSGARALHDACGDRVNADSLGVLTGEVLWQTSVAPVSGAVVRASWGDRDGDSAVSGQVDARGQFFICGVPRRRLVHLTASAPGAAMGTMPAMTGADLVTWKTISMP